MADIFGNFQRGYQVGQQNRAERQAELDRQKLRTLAPQIISGDPGAYDQAAVIDPKAAETYQGAGDAQTRRLKGAIGFIEAAQKSGKPEAVESAYQQVRPYLARFGQEPPATFAEAEPKFNEARARIAMLDAGQAANVQSTQILANGNIGIVTRTGQVIDTGQRASPTTQLINEPGQTPYLVTTGRGQVGITTGIGPGGAPQGAPPPQAPPPRMDDAAVNMVATEMSRAGVPEAQIDAWLQKQKSQPQFIGEGGAPAPMAAPAGPVPQRNPTAAEVEAAKTAAREQVELGYLPQRNVLEAQGAGATTAAQEQAKIDALPARTAAEATGAGQAEEAKQRAQVRVELEQLLPKVQSESQRTVALIDKALNHPGRAASTGLSSVNPLNLIPGSDAMNFRVLLEQLKGGTFLQAFQSLKGGGAITQVEGQKAEQAIARLNEAQSDEEFIVALQDLRDVARNLPSSIQEKLIAASKPVAGAASGGVARPTSEADYNALPRGALFIDPDDGQTYRKP